jgi:methionyl-tRNA formyltransferase
VPILAEDNIGSLYEKLMIAGGELLVRTVRSLADGTIEEMQQDKIAADSLKHAPKIFKEHTHIDWSKPVAEIHNLVRGLSPVPAAYTELGDKTAKIYKTHFTMEQPNLKPGDHDTDSKTYLRFAAADGWLYIDELQQEGKKRMDIVAFLRGFRG